MKINDKHDSWIVIENQFDLHNQHHKETIFTIGNGYLSTRGTLEERSPLDRQATFIHGMWDDVSIAFSELANAPDWTSLTIWVNNQEFSMSSGKINDYKRFLDLKTGILHRYLTWSSEDGETVLRLAFERFSSLADPNIAVLQVKITPLSGPCHLRIRGAIDEHVENNGILHWYKSFKKVESDQVDLVLRTRKTSKELAMSAFLLCEQEPITRRGLDCPGYPALEITIDGKKDETYVVQKMIGFATSRDTNNPLSYAKDRLHIASSVGYKKLRDNNCKAWSDFWEISQVNIDGDEEAQLALRHALFQLRIAAPTNDEHVSIGAKTLSGFGYRGHVFWDTEIFILPFFTLTHPGISRNMLMYRYHTIAGARRKADKNGYLGAQYAWESAETGDEVTPTWVPDFTNPLQLVRIWTGDIELHISSDIVFALYQYWTITGDEAFWLDIGIPILFETALHWGDRVECEAGVYTIRNVIGPDEYHEHVDNNVYTNYFVKWHMKLAVNMHKWLRAYHSEILFLLEERLGLNSKLVLHWEDVRDNIKILHDPTSGLLEQFEGFFLLKDVDWTKYKDRTKSMQEILGIGGVNQHQVLKQADALMLICLLRDEFDSRTLQANWDYYDPRTDHSYGSSLGPAIQAWAACEIGKPNLAYEHFIRAARADLTDIRGNANDGIHAASAGGLWQAVVFGFAGLRFDEGKPTLNPRLPNHWKRLAFQFKFQGEIYNADITSNSQRITRKTH